jgi:hypothetical protein
MIQDTVKEKFDSVRGIGTEDILAALGLERRRSGTDVLVPTIAIFAAGALVGAGAALLMAPRSGREMRRQLRGKATELGTSAGHMLTEARDAIVNKGEDAVHKVENGVKAERQEHRAAASHPQK